MGSRNKVGSIEPRGSPVMDDLDAILATDMRLDYYAEHVEFVFWTEIRTVAKVAMPRGRFEELWSRFAKAKPQRMAGAGH